MSTTRRLKEDQNYWNVIFSGFFIFVLVVMLWRIYREYHGFPQSISLFDAILLSFAAFRITRLVVYDKITRFFREWFVDSKEVAHEGDVWVELTPSGTGFRNTMHDLLTCPWCVGLWSGLIACYFYFMYPWAWFVILFLAISGAGSLLQILANGIGWRAENYKLDAYSKEKAGSKSDQSGL